jgi:hypothetical protein
MINSGIPTDPNTFPPNELSADLTQHYTPSVLAWIRALL